MTMNSGHDASEFVKNHVFVDSKLTIFHKIEGGKKIKEKETLSLEVRFRQGCVPNVCPHPCWITRTVHFA